MTGIVLSDHALLDVSLRAPNDPQFIDVEFVIDTGFVGYLTLPATAVQVLGLSLVRSITADLADGSSINVKVYELEIFWQGQNRLVEVMATGDVPLLGTLLLDGCELNIRFADHEAVTVSPL